MKTSDTPKVCGIYAIVNLINHKRYIGSSINTRKRWYGHKLHLRKNKHHSAHLQNAWNKYGEDSFIFVVLEECNESELIQREQFYLDHLADYNASPTAGNCTGVKHSDATKSRHSARMLRLMATNPSFVEHITTLSKGRPKSEGWKKTMSEKMKGSKKSKDHVLNMSRARAELSSSDVLHICELRKSGMSVKAIAEKIGVGFACVQRLLDGKSYRWVEGIASIEDMASWKLCPGRRGDQYVYKFFHEVHGVRECTKEQLINEFPIINSSALSHVCHGSKKSARGWRLVK